jgi:hypothetical protein
VLQGAAGCCSAHASGGGGGQVSDAVSLSASSYRPPHLPVALIWKWRKLHEVCCHDHTATAPPHVADAFSRVNLCFPVSASSVLSRVVSFMQYCAYLLSWLTAVCCGIGCSSTVQGAVEKQQHQANCKALNGLCYKSSVLVNQESVLVIRKT